MANDEDADGDKLEALIRFEPEHGTVRSIKGTGVVIYTPEEDFEGQVTFSYQAWDGIANSGEHTFVTIDVTKVPKGLSGAEIAGVVISVIAFTLVVVALVLIFLLMKKTRSVGPI